MLKALRVIGACLGMLILFSGVSTGAIQTKVLIIIVEEQGGTPSAALIKSSEMLLAKRLIKKQYDVITSDDLSAAKDFSRQDLEEARTGSIPAMRKAAALNNAGFIVSAKAKTSINEEDVVNMKLNKAVTTFSYRIVSTASGKTLDLDSLSYSTANRSGEAAAHATYETLSDDMADRLANQIPLELSDKESKQLGAYKVSLAPKPKPEPKPAAKPAPETTVALAETQKKPDPLPEPAAPPKVDKGPEIMILNPPPARGFQPVAKEKKLSIEGMATDESGIADLRINGEKIGYDAQGRFIHQVTLKPGENRFLVMAVNTKGKMASKDIAVNREQDTLPPKIVLLSPQATRGFQVVVKPKETNTHVEGIVTDDNDLLFVRVNGTDLTVSDTGHFNYDLALVDKTNAIRIDAADIFGNMSSKTLEIARGEGAWTETQAGGAAPSQAAAGLPAVKPVLWGLAIGVSNYTSKTINLNYADQDALELAKFFKAQAGKSFSEVHFKTLVNDEVTRNSIIENITTHLGKAGPHDIVFLFMAGHGTKHAQSGSYYFMPSDSEFDTILSKGLRMSDFEESVKIMAGNVEKIIVAMDTCHSGALRVGMRGGGETEDIAASISEASGLYILSASKAGEVSLESNRFKLDPEFSGHGVFTYALVEAMKGPADYDGNGYISVNEMFQAVARQVPRLTDGKQHPYFRMEGTDLPLVRLK
ncbi:MAG: caspase family protein [Pseudomonadota bacterium]